MESHRWVLYISIVVLLGLSAFFAAAETALSTINRIRLRKNAQEGNRRARAVLALIEQYEKTLTTILVANNLIAVAVSTMGTLVFTALFGAPGAVLSTIVFTTAFLMFEILPKTYANNNSERVALRVAGLLRGAGVVLWPVTYLFRRLQTALQKPGDNDEKPPSITEEELLHFIESIEEEGVLEEQESNLVQSALEFDETTLREIITPRVSLEALDADSSREEIVEFLMSAKHSRIPVYETSIDNIIGVLTVHDAMRTLLSGGEIALRELLTEPFLAHKGMKLSALLAVFRESKLPMAVVLDEYGGTMGIVTPTDLLYELVGDISGEQPECSGEGEDGSFEIDGGYDLRDMCQALEIDEGDTPGDYSTVNGWAMSLIGFIPQAGEVFEYEHYRFTVLEMDGNKIAKLKAEPLADMAAGENQDERERE